MPNMNVPVKQFLGLTPALDSRQIDKPFVLDGRNFLVDAQGPKSYFYQVYLSTRRLHDPQYVDAFTFGDDTIITSKDALLRFDPKTHTFYPICLFRPCYTLAKWQAARINGLYYFCHPDVGVIEYSTVTESCRRLVEWMPRRPSALCVSYGRVVVAGENTIAVSAIGGMDFQPSLTTGAVQQGINALTGGTALAAHATQYGFVVYTDRGMISAKYSDVETFQFSVLSSVYHPINSFCAVMFDDFRHVILDKKGLFITNGDSIEPFEPIFSEYLAGPLGILSLLDLAVPAIVELHYVAEEKLLFLSLGTNAMAENYQKSYVFQASKGEWGLFNRPHVSILPLAFDNGYNYGLRFGYMDAKGYWHKFSEAVVNEQEPSVSAAHPFNAARFNYPAFTQDSVVHFPSNLRLSTEHPKMFPNQTGVMEIGYTALATDGVSFPGEAESIGLEFAAIGKLSADALFFIYSAMPPNVDASVDSEITVGVFKFIEQKYPDEVSCVTDLIIGMEIEPPVDAEEDYMAIDPLPDEDFESSTLPDEDWGYMEAYTTDYVLDLLSTVDAKTLLSTGVQPPTLSAELGRSKRYACYSTGLMHVLKFTTPNPRQSFHLKTLDISGFLAGRL